MSALHRAVDRALDLVDDPMLVKELRGSFRRWRWLVLYTLALAWIGAVVLGTILQVDERSDVDPTYVGRQTFLGVLGLLAALSAVLFPAATCTAVVEERAAGSFELLVTTRLSAWRIVRGKLLAACVHGFLLLVSTAPLVAVTFLYGGVSLTQIVAGYAALLVGGAVLAAYGLLVSSLSAGLARAVVRTFLGLPFVALLTLGPIALIVGEEVVTPLQRGWSGGPLARGDPALTAAAWGAAFLWAVAWGALFLILAVARLQPERANRDTPLRVWFVSVWAVALGGLTALHLYAGPGGHATVVLLQCLGGAVIFFTIAAVALVTEGSRDVPARWPRALLLPGAGRGAALVLTLAAITLATLWLLNEAAARTVRPSNHLRALAEVRAWGTAWAGAYLVTVTLGALLLARLARNPAVARGVLVGLLVVANGVPALWYASASRRSPGRLYQGYALSMITAGVSIAAADDDPFDRRLFLFGPSGDDLQKAVDGWMGTLHHEVPGEADDPAVRQARNALLHARVRALAEQGVRVRTASTALYAALAVALVGANAAIALRRRAAAPP